MDGLFLACLMGICGLPEAPPRFETTARPPAALLATANSPAPARAAEGQGGPAPPMAERAAPRLGDASDGPPAAAELDKLSRASITKVVHQKTGAIKRCYEKGLVEDETFGGTVQIGWKIETDGHVTTATVIDATKRNVATEDCLKAEILTWRFPAASEPTAVGVYPFVLDAQLLFRKGP